MKSITKYSIIILLSISLIACLEPFFPKTEAYENVLVVKANLTNIQEKQKVVLTRTSQLEMDTILTESNAKVLIKNQLKHTYSFTESDELGVYLSDEEFKAIPNTAYTLYITTASGEQYESTEERLTPEASIDNLYALAKIVKGERGVQIYIDTNDNQGLANFFRYEFEETYKIITPYSVIKDIALSNIYNDGSSFDLIVSETTEEKKVCYSKGSQNMIMQVKSTDMINNSIREFPVRFIPETSHLLRERYSILAKQIVQSESSYNYFKALSNLGGNESVFVNHQPGYVQSNIHSPLDLYKKVVGYFEVSTVSTKRLFFNYEDFGFTKPVYPYECFTEILDYRDNTAFDTDQDEREKIYYYLTKRPPAELLEITWVLDSLGKYVPLYTFVNEECSNCTTFSSNIKPEFWED
jgi:3-hydroxymyristoyl/3-hydroxydecanoyl-(acyl carrier protein) dehydratase